MVIFFTFCFFTFCALNILFLLLMTEVQNLFWYTYCVDFFDLYRKLFNLSLNIFVFYFFVITVYMLNKTFLLSVYLAPSPAEAPHCSVVF